MPLRRSPISHMAAVVAVLVSSFMGFLLGNSWKCLDESTLGVRHGPSILDMTISSFASTGEENLEVSVILCHDVISFMGVRHGPSILDMTISSFTSTGG
jgi:hypothetical protein